MKTVYFISANKYKNQEVKHILGPMLAPKGIAVEAVYFKIHEIQHKDVGEIARDKVIKAYKKIGRPVFVEQTGLLIKGFGELPGGLTQLFWDSLHAETFAEFFVSHGATEVIAKSVLAYCTGRTIHLFEGETQGTIVRPKRTEHFQWDCVFQPENSQKTFAEMELDEKNEFSMRKKALEKLADYLEGTA